MKTSELKGEALDTLVAKCEGKTSLETYWFFPSTDWETGGPIIERERMGLDYFPDGSYENGGMWMAVITLGAEDGVKDGIEQIAGEGPTPLIAAMRCYVASKLGDEVEIPEELK